MWKIVRLIIFTFSRCGLLGGGAAEGGETTFGGVATNG